ncbi:MAG: hypothetical protein O3A51_11910, partial [Verrucomicrobia bacterium]|nr:hypothetical protein [Verrucomicrobiota bacterium]
MQSSSRIQVRPDRRGRRLLASVAAALGVATVIAFSPVLDAEFISFDDGVYVTDNVRVQQGLTLDNIRWALTATEGSNTWHPLTWLSHMVDGQLFGLRPAGHHAHNLLLHVINSLLVLVLFTRMTGALWRSAAVAAIFALHPQHVEPVAWIAERKELLCVFWWLTTLLAYTSYAVKKTECNQSTETRRKLWYGITLVCFVGGIMSKGMIVTLPVLLLLLDWWPLGRMPELAAGPSTLTSRLSGLGPLMREKIPFFALSLLACVLTLVTEGKGGSITDMASLPLWDRIGLIPAAYLNYLKDFLWPRGLAIIYPHPAASNMVQVGPALLSGLLLLGITIGALLAWRRWPPVMVGWLWFLVVVAPVSGIIQTSVFWMADRYMYMAQIGLAVAAVWGVAAIGERLPRVGHKLLAVSAVLLLGAASAGTYHQAGYWQDSETLFTHAVRVTEQNWVATANLAADQDRKGNLDDAIRYY